MRTSLISAGQRSGESRLEILDLKPPPGDMLAEVLGGLRRSPKHLPCKLLYDQTGSELFDRICTLPEYYPTRTETAILTRYAADIADVLGENCRLVEFGSGSSVKIRILLDALHRPAYYVPIDISRAHLLAAARAIARDYPGLQVQPIVADYTLPLHLPVPGRPVTSTCGFFPGSTIGNFEIDHARRFLDRIGKLVGRGGGLLLGVDLRKDPEVIEQAYNDAAGVTAAFNLNILKVINRHLDSDFDIAAFRHRAVYDPDAGRIEMRLISTTSQQVTIGDQHIELDADEYIITEYSHKYELGGVRRLAAAAGLSFDQVWCDDDDYFAVCHLSVTAKPQRSGNDHSADRAASVHGGAARRG